MCETRVVCDNCDKEYNAMHFNLGHLDKFKPTLNLIRVCVCSDGKNVF